MEKSFPFNAVTVDGVPDRVYAAEDFAAERAAYVSNGVTAEGALAVHASASGGLAVDIAPGIAVIDGYTYYNTSPLTLPVAAADKTRARCDLAVLRLDLDAREMRCHLLTGTPAAAPVPPDMSAGDTVREMPLAQLLIPAGAAGAEEVQITDLRPRADYILNRLDVEEILSRYEQAIADFFDVSDAAALAESASVVKTNAGSGSVLCGDGVYRTAVLDGEKKEELVRITVSGTFDPASYPTKDGLYDVILQGGGGSGAWGSEENGSHGGEAGGIRILSGIPLRAGVSYPVTIGAGGEQVHYIPGNAVTQGKDGGATSFAGFTVLGGKKGTCNSSIGFDPNPTEEADGYVHAPGGMGTGSRGGDSLLAAGGRNNYTGDGYAGTLGSGGGAAYMRNATAAAHSGAGGSGIVIIRGVRA